MQAVEDWQITRSIVKYGKHIKLDYDIDFYYMIEGTTLGIYCEESRDLKQSLWDWIIDLWALPPKYNNKTFYHRGFYFTAMKIISYLNNNIGLKGYTIDLYGYSLGAGVSSIILDKLSNVSKHVTFGEPANCVTFNKEYKTKRSNSIRYVQGNDIVTRIAFMFKHYSKKIQLPSIGDMFENHDYWGLS